MSTKGLCWKGRAGENWERGDPRTKREGRIEDDKGKAGGPRERRGRDQTRWGGKGPDEAGREK